jgi:uncharacterized protein YndB with AHSA1/START domain
VAREAAGAQARGGGRPSLTESVHIDAPPDVVYEYFTRPDLLMRWMGERALLEPRPGGRFALEVTGHAVRGAYLELDPPHRLVLSWGYAGSSELPPGASTVEVRFVATGDGTRVELEHRDLPESERAGHAVGWRHYLARLAAKDPGPDPGMPVSA